MWGLAKDKNAKISVIGQGLEKYLLIQWGQHLEFKDSLQFLPASLERLVENLKTCETDKFFQLRKSFPNASPRQLELLKQKGVYPYDWMDSKEKLNQEHLPAQVEFNSILRNEARSDEDYARAKEVWQEFNFQKFIDYHEHYLKCSISTHYISFLIFLLNWILYFEN